MPRPSGPVPGGRFPEIRVRLDSLEDKQRILDHIAEHYPRMSMNAFVLMAIEEKMEREK